MSDLIRALAIATAISRLSAHPNLRTYATRRFQYVTRTTILRRHSQRVLTFRQISRQEQRERRRVVDGDLVVRQFRGGTFGIGQRNTYRLVVTNHLQHRATDKEVVARSGTAVLQARLAILGLQDVHDVRLLAEDLHHGLGDRLAQGLVLRERDVDGIILLVPNAALDHAFQLGDGTEQTRVHAIAV